MKKNKRKSNLPESFSILSEAYTKFLTKSVHKATEKDEIISEILYRDELQREYIRRLIIDEGDMIVAMRLLGLDVRQHHLLMINFFEHLREIKKTSGLLLAPRGSGKSTACDFVYNFIKGLQDPVNHTTLLVSHTEEQSKDFLSAIKGYYEKDQVKEIFGDMKGDTWAATAANLKGKDPGLKEKSFNITSVDSATVSKHYKLIMCDDMVDEENSSSELLLDKTINYFYKSVLPCLKPGSELRCLGTRYSPDDIYGHWMKNDPMFKNSYMIIPGVFDKETGETVDLEQDEDGEFFVPNNATVFDPEGFPEELLLERRSGMTAGAFDSQYQNQTDILRGDIFNVDKFNYYTEDPVKLVGDYDLIVGMGVDLAATQDSKNDEFAIVVTGAVRKTFEFYVLDYLAGRFNLYKQIQLIKEMFDIWEPVCTFIESNAYQAVLDTAVNISFPDVRTKKIYTTKDKITRAEALSVYYDKGKVYHRHNRSAKLDAQLGGFPRKKLKDLFDALYFSIFGTIRHAGRKKRRTKEPGLF